MDTNTITTTDGNIAVKNDNSDKPKNIFFNFKGEVKNMSFDYVWSGIKHNLKVTYLNNKNNSPYVNREIYMNSIKFFKPLARDLWELYKEDRKISKIKY
jgi:hypothetical protein